MSQEQNPDLVDANGCAEIARLSHSTSWLRLVKNGTAPKPVPGHPLRWNRTGVVTWALKRQETPTIAKVEASGKWVCAKNSGYSPQAIAKWKKNGQLTAKDCRTMDVKIEHAGAGSTFIEVTSSPDCAPCVWASAVGESGGGC